ncbi:MAG: hypothetical protein ACTSRK_10740 [Promethearchaeota archaeon]
MKLQNCGLEFGASESSDTGALHRHQIERGSDENPYIKIIDDSPVLMEICVEDSVPIYYDSPDLASTPSMLNFPPMPEFRTLTRFEIPLFPRPIERYLAALMEGSLSERYYNRILQETSGEVKKMLLDRLPPEHPLRVLLQKALEVKINGSLSSTVAFKYKVL